MMSTKQFTAMLTLHLVYLVVGASIFRAIERPLEMRQRDWERQERIIIFNLLYDNYIPSDPEKQDDILRKLSDYCGKPMFNYTSDEDDPPIKWDFYHSFFFSYTVVSTIGYGNLAPTTSLGRILMIFYGLFGIPINGILLANLGEYFGKQLITVYSKYHKNHEARADKLDLIFHRLGMFGQIVLYLVPGFLFFIFLPACLFMVFESWDYVESVYYAFVTLTTIGFGDIVAGTVNNGFGTYFTFYQIFLIIWITFGLGYIVMLLGFLTSALRSKHIHALEHKLVQNIKNTQNRVLKGFSRDVGYLRRIINEAYLMKFKPVYCESDYPRLYKSSSCPIFTFDIEPREPFVKRKRANSENIYLSARDMLRIQSDTDLLGIDKDRTFTAAAIVKPAELLARVVNALGAIDSQPECDQEGTDMFSDEEILRSEKSQGWMIGKDQIYSDSPRSQRARALSMATIPNYRNNSGEKYIDDMTWPNGDAIDKSHRHPKLSLPIEGISPIEEDAEEETESKGILSKLNPFRKRGENEESPAEYLKNTVRGRLSMFSGGDAPKHRFHPGLPGLEEDQRSHRGDESVSDMASDIQAYQNRTRKGRGSLFPSFGRKVSKDESVSDLPMDIQNYQNRTKKGRASLFPSFGKDKSSGDDEEKESDLAADIKEYRKLTQRGRASIFPSFDFGQRSEEDSLPDLAADILNYQNKTKRGRGSLFSGDIENFQKSTGGAGGRRKSLFSPDVNVSEMPEPEQAEMLEQTSVADLIRALAVLHSSPPLNQRKHGMPNQQPGLLDLIAPELAAAASAQSGPPGARRRGSVHPGLIDLPGPLPSANLPGARRRGSVRPDFALPFNPPEHPSGPPGSRRRGSIRPDFVLPTPSKPAADADDPLSGARRRRISVRQAGTGFTPTLATVTSGSELQSTPPEQRERKISMHALPPPSYDESEASPATARVRRYSPASGGPGAARRGSRASPVPRLYSRMRKESVEEEPTPPSETRSRQSSLTDIVVDDNKNKT